MFANQKSELPKYLAGLAKGTSLCSIANSQMNGATLLKNFRFVRCTMIELAILSHFPKLKVAFLSAVFAFGIEKYIM